METNVSPVDWFTLVHFAIGLWAGQWFTPAQVGTTTIAFEIAERPAKERWPQLFPHPGQDSFANSATDVIAAWAGAQVIRLCNTTNPSD